MTRAPSSHTHARCSACGAVLSLPSATIAGGCSYCDARLVDAAAEEAIDRVCPFRIGQRGAQQRLRARLAQAAWAPGDVRRLARMGQLRPEELRGVLVPYYAYAAHSESRWRARIGVDWWRAETVRDADGKSRTERVRETEWFDSEGTAVDQVAAHLVCASEALSPDEVARLGAFDLGRGVAFDARVLAGAIAELPTRPRRTVDAEARAAIERLAATRVATRVLPGDHRHISAFRCEVSLQSVSVVLVPVWVATYRHRGRVHRLLVHGQSGRCVGQPPISATKVSLAAAGLAVAIVALLWLAGVFG